MQRSIGILGIATAMVTAALATTTTATGQEEKPTAPAAAAEFQPPKPGPEHEILKQEAGVWDAKVEMWSAPGGPPEVSKGVETNVLIGEGLWLIQDIQSTLMGAPFQGHGVLGYDVAKRKYVGTWVDSMAPGLSTVEGDYDAKTKTLTARIEGPCPTGVVMKFRMTTEWKADGTRVATMYSPEGEASEFVMMKITYTRRPAATGASD